MLEVKIRNMVYNGADKPVLDGVCFAVREGELVCITGKNGTGKSTLLNCMTGIIPHVIRASGEFVITLDGEKLESSDLEYVSEGGYNAMFYLNVRAQLYHISEEDRKALLADFGMLHKSEAAIQELSMGERKIISLLAALKTKRKVCILDEPTVFLDDEKIRRLLALIDREKAEKHILLISHDPRCMEAADSSYELREGQLFSYEFQKGEVQTFKEAGSQKSEPSSQVLLHIPAFSYAYPGGTNCFDKYPVTLYEKEIVGICGGNGSGKTTLMNYILKNAGLLYKKGYTKKKLTCLGMMQDFHKQFFAYSAEDELRSGKKSYGADTYEAILKDMGLWKRREENPHFLSDGQKRLLLLGSLMLQEADLLILDEPLDNLDRAKAEQAKTFIRLHRNNVGTIVVLDQNMELYEDLLDRVIML